VKVSAYLPWIQQITQSYKWLTEQQDEKQEEEVTGYHANTSGPIPDDTFSSSDEFVFHFWPKPSLKSTSIVAFVIVFISVVTPIYYECLFCYLLYFVTYVSPPHFTSLHQLTHSFAAHNCYLIEDAQPSRHHLLILIVACILYVWVPILSCKIVFVITYLFMYL